MGFVFWYCDGGCLCSLRVDRNSCFGWSFIKIKRGWRVNMCCCGCGSNNHDTIFWSTYELIFVCCEKLFLMVMQ